MSPLARAAEPGEVEFLAPKLAFFRTYFSLFVEHVLVVSLLGVLLTIWSVYCRRDRERTRREAIESRKAESGQIGD